MTLRSRLTVAVAGSLAVGGVALAGPALAYPTPSGAGSGTCSPDQQSVVVGGSVTNLLCTFTFVGPDGNAPGVVPVSVSSTQGTAAPQYDAATYGDGRYYANVHALICTQPGSYNVSVTATATLPSGTAAATAFASVTCTPAAAGVQYEGQAPDPDHSDAGLIPGYQSWLVQFSTTAPAGTAVSFSKSGDGFVFNNDTQVESTPNPYRAGFRMFQATVFVKDGSSVSITGVVSASAQLAGGSATGLVAAQ